MNTIKINIQNNCRITQNDPTLSHPHIWSWVGKTQLKHKLLKDTVQARRWTQPLWQGSNINTSKQHKAAQSSGDAQQQP